MEPAAIDPRFSARITVTGGAQLDLPLSSDAPLFVVGPNGAGKSSLMQYIYRRNIHTAVRVSAHRQTWMETNAPPFSAHEKRNAEASVKSWDSGPDARWRETNPGSRSGLIIASLVDADNYISRKVRVALKEGLRAESESLATTPTPLEIINSIFHNSGIPIVMAIGDDNSILARKNDGSSYSIVALSDGERAAFLVAGSVLTAPDNSLILLDEPERHIHRSISAPLIRQLVSYRPDCTFIVSTHDLELPTLFPTSKIVILREAHMIDSQPVGWELDILTSHSEIADDVKETILGSRRKVIFVEGDDSSLDKALYQILFPNVSIYARGNCAEVIRSVMSMRTAANLTWLEVYGIVDQDQITESRRNELRSEHIFPLSMYSVESIYYSETVMKFLSERQSAVFGIDSTEMIKNAKIGFISAISNHIDTLAARMTEGTIRNELKLLAIDWRQIPLQNVLSVNIDISIRFQNEIEHLRSLVAASNVAAIIQRYPVRQTPALTAISAALQFKNRGLYEAAVRKAVSDDGTLRDELLAHFEGLVGLVS
ncbi:AAA family ATPase [Roseococcus sp. SDR]|uniref:AAA family ATPase n=1 Tax=Roseococcus sp. SDR TaxID=2835532 RepID=UPI001BCFBD6C|nr:AAA family ATPase [Roseococcus sp. SDR]MBS7789755.1 AAA family ATPase [Roseococcus sp. SDR]MBV1845069.1 AAA family ATPase [Roseococcus sp. SDR]